MTRAKHRRPRPALVMIAGVAGALALAIVSATGAAHAQVARAVQSDGAKEELTTLERSLAEQHDTLSTADCATACRALASILRAADRICALDPGDRCAAGRAKADDATRRVREACPECAIASGPRAPAPPSPEERAMTKGGSKAGSEAPQPAQESVTAVQPGPPSESKRGGCAGCTAMRRARGDDAGHVLAALVLAFAVVLRRRRRNPRS